VLYLAAHGRVTNLAALPCRLSSCFYGGHGRAPIISDIWITVFIFWELTLDHIIPVLIGLQPHQGKSHAARAQALVVTGGGGLSLLALASYVQWWRGHLIFYRF